MDYSVGLVLEFLRGHGSNSGDESTAILCAIQGEKGWVRVRKQWVEGTGQGREGWGSAASRPCSPRRRQRRCNVCPAGGQRGNWRGAERERRGVLHLEGLGWV